MEIETRQESTRRDFVKAGAGFVATPVLFASPASGGSQRETAASGHSTDDALP